jgi:hypothetical protein
MGPELLRGGSSVSPVWSKSYEGLLGAARVLRGQRFITASRPALSQPSASRAVTTVADVPIPRR